MSELGFVGQYLVSCMVQREKSVIYGEKRRLLSF